MNPSDFVATAHTSKRDVPPKLGVIRGVPFVDTPREQLETVVVSRASWEELKRGVRMAQESALVACGLAGLAIAVALIVAMNVWH